MSRFSELVEQAIMQGVEPEEARRRATIAVGTKPIEDKSVEELRQDLIDMPAEAFAQSSHQDDIRSRFESGTEEERAAFNEKHGLTDEVLAMSGEEQSAYWADKRAEAARLRAATEAREAAIGRLVESGIDREAAERSVAGVEAFMPEKPALTEVQKLRQQLRNSSREDMGLPEDADAAAVALQVQRSKAAGA